MDAKVDNPGLDHVAMSSYWTKIAAIMSGAEAIRKAGPKFLPQFPHETNADYAFRRDNAKLTNIFGDIVETLSAKPFSKEVGFSGNPPSWAQDFAEDVDARGNHIHVFAADLFHSGIADALTWVLVDFTRSEGAARTVAEERSNGARAYWCKYNAADVLTARSAFIDGKEQFVHVRLKERHVEISGYEETVKERVRVLEREKLENDSYGPAKWELWEKQKQAVGGTDEWSLVDEGTFSIKVIPLVPFVTGRRVGSTWEVMPVLRDAADLQIKLYQYENGLDYAKDNTAFPMLAGNGVTPATNEKGDPIAVPVGPKTVLYAPPNGEGEHGEWKFIEPSATSLKFLADDIEKTKGDLRELGRQPLTAQTGNITTITAAFAGDKANSVIQAWVLNLKDALENCFRFTAMWLSKSEEPEIEVNTDFALDFMEDDGLTELSAARGRGDLSQRTYWREMRRRGVLGPDFDADDEEKALIDELPGDDTEEEQIASLAA